MARPGRQMPPTDLSRRRSFTSRQQELLADLEEIFFKEGFRNLTILELAARLRCSRRTLYELAPSKDEIVLLVIDRLLQRTGRQAMAKVRALDDPVQRVHAYLSTASTALHHGTEAFSTDVAAHPGAHRLFQEHYRFATSVCAHLIQEGVDQGAFRGIDPQLAAEVIYAGLDRLQEPEVLQLTGHTNAEAIQQMIDLIVYGLAPAGGIQRGMKPSVAG